MVQKKAGTGVKNKPLYKRLRKLGVSSKESARVAGSAAKSSRKASRSDASTTYANLKLPQLHRRAKKAGIKGRSAMNKKQLIKALRAS